MRDSMSKGGQVITRGLNGVKQVRNKGTQCAFSQNAVALEFPERAVG